MDILVWLLQSFAIAVVALIIASYIRSLVDDTYYVYVERDRRRLLIYYTKGSVTNESSGLIRSVASSNDRVWVKHRGSWNEVLTHKE